MVRFMSTAQQLFIGYAVIVLAVAFALGALLGGLRMKAPAVRNLATAHVETLIQSALHLGLAFAVGAVGFASATATWAAALLVAGSAMQAVGATLNWATNTADQFASRSAGFRLNSVATFVILPGLIIAAIGILTRL
jgi:hypothetical protein